MQKQIAAPLTPTWNVIPTTAEGWKEQVNAGYQATMKALPALREALHVKVEPMTIDGAKAYRVTPETIAPENRNRLLVHVHGGCFVSFPGESGTVEAIYMAGFGRFKVISVDYRMPPDHPYPAGLEDAMTVWKAATKMARPKNMAIFGSSAGGNLTLAMVLRAKQDKLPLPAAIAPGTPMSDLTLAGDSFQTNAMLDNVLVAPGANCDKRAALYTDGRDPKDRCSSEIAAVGVERCALVAIRAGRDEHVVEHRVGLKRVAGEREVGHRRAGRDRRPAAAACPAWRARPSPASGCPAEEPKIAMFFGRAIFVAAFHTVMASSSPAG